MVKETRSRKIVKPTFEAVLNAQERLRAKLNELIKENRCLKDEKERLEFMQLLAHATLGLGVNQIVKLNATAAVCIRENVEVTCRWLASQKENVVLVPLCLYKSKPYCKAAIHFLWQCVLDNLYYVFPLALDKSISMSKEKDEAVQTKGYMVE